LNLPTTIQTGNYKSLASAAATIWTINHGNDIKIASKFRNMYKGFGATLMREVEFFSNLSYIDIVLSHKLFNSQIPYSLIQFPLYEYLKVNR